MSRDELKQLWMATTAEAACRRFDCRDCKDIYGECPDNAKNIVSDQKIIDFIIRVTNRIDLKSFIDIDEDAFVKLMEE